MKKCITYGNAKWSHLKSRLFFQQHLQQQQQEQQQQQQQQQQRGRRKLRRQDETASSSVSFSRSLSVGGNSRSVSIGGVSSCSREEVVIIEEEEEDDNDGLGDFWDTLPDPPAVHPLLGKVTKAKRKARRTESEEDKKRSLSLTLPNTYHHHSRSPCYFAKSPCSLPARSPQPRRKLGFLEPPSVKKIGLFLALAAAEWDCGRRTLAHRYSSMRCASIHRAKCIVHIKMAQLPYMNGTPKTTKCAITWGGHSTLNPGSTWWVQSFTLLQYHYLPWLCLPIKW